MDFQVPVMELGEVHRFAEDELVLELNQEVLRVVPLHRDVARPHVEPSPEGFRDGGCVDARLGLV